MLSVVAALLFSKPHGRKSMKTYIVTGATRGLGLETARALSVIPDTAVVLAVRDLPKGQAIARDLGSHVEARALDLASLADVRRFAEAWSGPLAGLVNNAGVQETTATKLTSDGLETTIGTNHLAAFALTDALLPALRGGRVLFIGSGTHNPTKAAAAFGFRGGRFTSIEALARGDTDATDEKQANRDRYATSKLLNTVTAMEWARRNRATTFLTLDPGLMPGTGLARNASLPARIAWFTLMRLIAPLLPDTSTARRSGRTAAWLMTDPSLTAHTGEVYSFDRKPSKQVWDKARDPQLGAAVMDQTAAFLQSWLGRDGLGLGSALGTQPGVLSEPGRRRAHP